LTTHRVQRSDNLLMVARRSSTLETVKNTNKTLILQVPFVRPNFLEGNQRTQNNPQAIMIATRWIYLKTRK
jgi:hypothetical protein